MAQIFLTILFCILVVAFICCVILLIILPLVDKSLLCAKIYTFIFEQDDWLLYKKAKKQGIQHYLNSHHLSQFFKEINKVRKEYGVTDNNFSELDVETIHTVNTKYDELAEKYYYKEYNNAEKNIKDDDIVLSLYNERLFIGVGPSDKRLLIWKPMVKDVLRGHEIWANGKTDDNIKCLLANPKEVVSF